MIELFIPGPPKGKDRPRFDPRSGRAYTTQATKDAERTIREAWVASGKPVLEDGPLSLSMTIDVARPQSHLRVNGELSAEGLRHPNPHRQKPDVDNCLKLVMDALNGAAYTDDVQVIDANVVRSWAGPDGPGIHVVIEQVSGMALGA